MTPICIVGAFMLCVKGMIETEMTGSDQQRTGRGDQAFSAKDLFLRGSQLWEKPAVAISNETDALDRLPFVR